MTPSIEIRAIQPEDRSIVNSLTVKHWHETRIGYVDRFIESSTLPGFVAVIDTIIVAALTWRLHDNSLHIVTLVSTRERMGIGGALINEAEREAQRQKISRVLISTENNNVEALLFYQKRGYALHELHRNVMVRLRQEKPSIPEADERGIPIRDQIDLIKEL